MIKGIFPPIATPFVKNEIAFDKLEKNISKWNKTDLAGYVVMGSNGESAFLSFKEKIKLIEAVKKYKSNDKLLIAGTGSDSINETISLTNEAAESGADYALILTPSFFKDRMKENNFIKYFTSVADKIKIPLIIYNVPKFTGVNIEPETVSQLAEHQNIIGMKNSSENIAHLSEVIYKTPKTFSNLVGTASVLFAGLCVGASGGIMALANIAPNQCVQIKKYFDEKKFDRALKIQMQMLAINKAVTAKYGVPGLKAALDLTGYFGGTPRLPLTPLDKKDIKFLKKILIDAQLI